MESFNNETGIKKLFTQNTKNIHDILCNYYFMYFMILCIVICIIFYV